MISGGVLNRFFATMEFKERNVRLMKKILVVLTGGTIGSKVEGDIIDIKDKSPYQLISLYGEVYRKKTEEFDIIEPITTLSENMTPELLSKLCHALDHISYEQYAGVIITHGSDTLSYTAALVGMLFHHVPVPMVLVASNLPLLEKGSNGLSNFAAAVDLIREAKLRGVFVIYGNPEGAADVYLSTRVVEADPYTDGFRDFSGSPFGKMENGHFVPSGRGDAPSIEEVNGAVERNFELPKDFGRSILLIRPYPGMSYEQFDLKNPPAAVLHYLYHSATACTQGENTDFQKFADKCKSLGIPVYVASLKEKKGKRYATGDIILKTGAIPLYNISPEAAYAKLMILYNSGTPIWENIGENLYFESIKWYTAIDATMGIVCPCE